jgi:hypothetical protein
MNGLHYNVLKICVVDDGWKFWVIILMNCVFETCVKIWHLYIDISPIISHVPPKLEAIH